VRSAWDGGKLRVNGGDGPAREGGDELRTRTGRRYQIIAITGRSLECLVLPADAKIQGRVFHWKWGTRSKGR
jgi:hypothetical protein